MTIREQAQSVKDRFNATVEEIRQNTRYTAQAKADLIRDAYDEARTSLSYLKRELKEESKAATAATLRTLFDGTEHGVDSYRDALDRASRVDTPAQAMYMLGRADIAGDPALKQAVAQIAYERAWPDVLAEWARNEDKPEAALILGAPSNTAAQAIGDSVRFSIPAPAELDHHFDRSTPVEMSEIA